MENLPESVIKITTKKDMFGNIIWVDDACNIPQTETK